ncbi:hypothetical protein AB0F07_31945 [Streptomyces fructofermentans]|uniref:hypothetical protein n=1 Tax=Streptomyces fructofermentans TaxID=152141 RepID=UPI0033E3F834
MTNAAPCKYFDDPSAVSVSEMPVAARRLPMIEAAAGDALATAAAAADFLQHPNGGADASRPTAVRRAARVVRCRFIGLARGAAGDEVSQTNTMPSSSF